MSDESLADLVGLTEESNGETVELVAVQPISYRHKKIANFMTGEDKPDQGLYVFEFRDHILTITGSTQEEVEAKNEAFLKLARGFLNVDKINIVRLRNIQNEMSLAEASQKVVRGAVGTNNVADKPVDQTEAAPKAPSSGISGLSFLKQT